MKQEDIDEKLKKLQYKLEHTSMNLDEEKQILKQMKDLEGARSRVAHYNEQMDKMSDSNEMRENVIQELKNLDNQLQAIKDYQTQLQDQLNEIRAKESSSSPDMFQLNAERKECYEVIKAAKLAKSQVYAERKAAFDEYYQREREVKQQLRVERQARYCWLVRYPASLVVIF